MGNLELRQLKKSFRKAGKELPVLQGVDLVLPEKQITVLIGKSGCGKTTLLRILGGLESYDSGQLIRPEGGRIGMVFQQPRLMPWLCVEQNIAFSDTAGQLTPGRVGQLIALTGLTGFEKMKPYQLSGGMQQRVALARALAYDPQWLLMDEPFAALDYFTRMAMQQELLRIQKEAAKGIVFVTHSIEEALTIGNRILLLQGGRIACEYDLCPWGEDRDMLSGEMVELKRKILKDMEVMAV